MPILGTRAGTARLALFLATAFLLARPASGREFWHVQTRACPQVMGTDPWPTLRASRLEAGGCMARRDPSELLGLAGTRPVVILVHGSYYNADQAVAEGDRIRGDLATYGALAPDAVVVAFDWPSQRIYPNLIKDANEKARRAAVAGYHLARFLQAFPTGGRVSLIGQSHGGYAVLSALHLLGGGSLDDGCDPCRPSVLPECPPALRLRAVVIEPACDRQWLDPGERLGHALPAVEGVLCLYNKLDPVLVVHPFGKYSDHHRALGKTGLGRSQTERLGPMASRYRERGIGSLIGAKHTFGGATANPVVATWIAPYAWAVCRPAAAQS
ncbi:alpha/beta hydrolase [Tundrisphaera sp. TA3]|uniref:alpha/beta hydrolase n=1 Tax=Tundrisphaera sp. TA3 TaxID=3435775 RepID=UPI003EBD55E7